MFAHAPEVGAQPILTAALADLPGGTHVTRRHLHGLKGAPVGIAPERIDADPALRSGLWVDSERLTGVTYDLGVGARGEGVPG